MRTIATPPFPSGVAIAAMVSVVRLLPIIVALDWAVAGLD